jgi:hypothetical protein
MERAEGARPRGLEGLGRAGGRRRCGTSWPRSPRRHHLHRLRPVTPGTARAGRWRSRRTGEGADAGYELVDRLSAGDAGILVLDRTPFYGESGGQVGDTGTLRGGRVPRDRHQKARAAPAPRRGRPRPWRRATCWRPTSTAAGGRHTRRNHTATHLLHAALRAVLGDHVTQKGSLVGPDRLRFDFSHHKPMTADELSAVEELVNEQILRNTGLTVDVETSTRRRPRARWRCSARSTTPGRAGRRRCPASRSSCAAAPTSSARTGDIGSSCSASASDLAKRLKTEPGRVVDKLQDERRASPRVDGDLREQADRCAPTIEAQTGHGALEAVAPLVGGVLRPPRDGRMAFVKSPDGHSVELLQRGAALPPAEPWASRPNVGEW